jgi:hypothetical protein
VPEKDKPDVFIKPAPPVANETVQVEREREREAAKKAKQKPKPKPKPSLNPTFDFPDLPDMFKDALKEAQEKEKEKAEAEARPSSNPIFDLPDSLKDSIHIEMEELPDDEDDYGNKLSGHDEL